jgi:hypothetical protein
VPTETGATDAAAVLGQLTQRVRADANQALAVETLFASRPPGLRCDGFHGVRRDTDEAVEVSHRTSTATAGTATIKPSAKPSAQRF